MTGAAWAIVVTVAVFGGIVLIGGLIDWWYDR